LCEEQPGESGQAVVGAWASRRKEEKWVMWSSSIFIFVIKLYIVFGMFALEIAVISVSKN
jgi:hypothetical protein